jgi:hypothetical protein
MEEYPIEKVRGKTGNEHAADSEAASAWGDKSHTIRLRAG